MKMYEKPIKEWWRAFTTIFCFSALLCLLYNSTFQLDECCSTWIYLQGCYEMRKPKFVSHRLSHSYQIILESAGRQDLKFEFRASCVCKSFHNEIRNAFPFRAWLSDTRIFCMETTINPSSLQPNALSWRTESMILRPWHYQMSLR